ncbi:MAG: DUF7064 domain-containing protein [Promethearchaeota archaeon]
MVKEFDITEKDEYKHDWGKFPPFHNESWYFNFIDRPNKVFFVTRLSFHMDKKNSQILLFLVIDGKARIYLKENPVDKMPDNWEFDTKVKYYCIKPMKQWRIKFENSKINLDINFEGRFSVYSSAVGEDIIASIKKGVIEPDQVAAQMHYEQPMIATGILNLKKKGEIIETRNIKGFSQRDHSWGIRDWVRIDGWNWVSAQFENETINLYTVDALGKNILQGGIIYFKDGDKTKIEKIEVTTKYKDDGKTPVSSTFVFTDEKGEKRTMESKTIFSQYLPRPSPKGLTEIYEQVAIFTRDDKEGDGISEYLTSTRH